VPARATARVRRAYAAVENTRPPPATWAAGAPSPDADAEQGGRAAEASAAATAADSSFFTAPFAVVDRVAVRRATSCAVREAAMMAPAASATAAAAADTKTKKVAVAALPPLSPWLSTTVKDADNVNYSVFEGAMCATVDRGHLVTGQRRRWRHCFFSGPKRRVGCAVAPPPPPGLQLTIGGKQIEDSVRISWINQSSANPQFVKASPSAPTRHHTSSWSAPCPPDLCSVAPLRRCLHHSECLAAVLSTATQDDIYQSHDRGA